ncbi:hypothetical protein ACFC1D_16200 [Streptomyces vinaceus]|uniref:hypothetical protein n=1 Tax=Streptomyces vinaceus TaxID=1960 RepID=UPI0035DC7381
MTPPSGEGPWGDLELTLAAESVAASGFTPQQLARMLLVRTNYSATEVGKDWTGRPWTVTPDGALTLAIPACTNNCSGVFLQISGAPREQQAVLKAQLKATSPGYDSTPLPMSVDYFGRAGTQPVTFGASGTFVPVTPGRLLDTRNGTGAPAQGVTAVVLNVTATNPTTDSHVIAYPHGSARPTASNLNFAAGQTIPNQVTVPVGADGTVDLYNNAGSVDLIADISGYYSATGSKFVPTGPTRVLDTRQTPGKRLGEHEELYIQPNSWKYGIPPFGVTGVTMNVTATGGTSDSHLSVED